MEKEAQIVTKSELIRTYTRVTLRNYFSHNMILFYNLKALLYKGVRWKDIEAEILPHYEVSTKTISKILKTWEKEGILEKIDKFYEATEHTKQLFKTFYEIWYLLPNKIARAEIELENGKTEELNELMQITEDLMKKVLGAGPLFPHGNVMVAYFMKHLTVMLTMLSIAKAFCPKIREILSEKTPKEILEELEVLRQNLKDVTFMEQRKFAK